MAWKRMDPIAKPLMDRAERAIVAGLNDTTAAAAISAKNNHAWRVPRGEGVAVYKHLRLAVLTGVAEGSIRMEPAKKISPTTYRGEFGSYDVKYFEFLEFGTHFMPGDFTLRRAADAEFPNVGRNIGRYL